MQPLKRWKRRLSQGWAKIKASKPGERFREVYERQKLADQHRSAVLRWLRPLLALLSLAIGVVLAFIPGPAFVFFGISAALLATESLYVARALDRTELWLRAQRAKLRRKQLRA